MAARCSGQNTAMRRAGASLARCSDPAVTLNRLSHELRTPLNGLLSALARMPADAEPATIAWASAARLHDRLEDLLDLAALACGEARAQPMQGDPALWWHGVVEAAHATVIRHGAILALDEPLAWPGNWRLDGARAARLIAALVDNAARAAGRGGTVALALKLDATSTDQAAMHVTIADDGPGLSRRQWAMRRHPFVQGPERSDGLGLGLCLAMGFAALLGGRLALDTAVTGGACWRLRLPIKLAQAWREPSAPLDEGAFTVALGERTSLAAHSLRAQLRRLGAEIVETPADAEVLLDADPVSMGAAVARLRIGGDSADLPRPVRAGALAAARNGIARRAGRRPARDNGLPLFEPEHLETLAAQHGEHTLRSSLHDLLERAGDVCRAVGWDDRPAVAEECRLLGLPALHACLAENGDITDGRAVLEATRAALRPWLA